MSFRGCHLPYFLIILFLTLFFTFFFPDFFLHPNSFLICSDFDGLKNYFTVSYYVNHDSGFHFTGMNYPYGSHIIYTDNQPILSFIVKFLGQQEYTVGIINASMFISFYLCAFFLFKILREAKLPTWYAVICSVIITILSPQLFRITGHYGLAYAAFIPMIWFFLIRFYKSGSYLSLASVFIIILFFGLLHPYYLPLGMVMFVAIFGLAYLQKRKTFRFIIPGLLIIILPAVLFQIMMIVTDSSADRAESLYGPVTYRASFESVFFPVTSPILDIWKWFIPLKAAKFEGYAFVGSSGLLILLFSLLKVYRYVRLKKYSLIFKPILPEFLSVSIWAAVLVLFFSMAIPWKWDLEFLLEYLTPFKQFRSIGRFAWIFYYIFTVYISYFIYLNFRYYKRNNPTVSLLVLCLCLFVWLVDGITQAKAVSDTAKTYMSENFFNQIEAKNNTEYQALIGLPFYLTGTEKVELQGSASIRKKTMKESFLKKLPMVNGVITRVSWSEEIKILQLLNSPGMPNGILQKLNPEMPLWLIVDKHAVLREQEIAIVAVADFIEEDDSFQYFRLWPESLKKRKQFFEAAEEADAEVLIYKSFDSPSTPIPYLGNGAFEAGEEEEERLILEGNLQSAKADSSYKLSYWIYLDPSKPGVPSLTFEIFNSQGKTEITNVLHYKNLEFDIIDNWMRLEYEFEWRKEFNKVRIYANEEGTLVDEMVISMNK